MHKNIVDKIVNEAGRGVFPSPTQLKEPGLSVRLIWSVSRFTSPENFQHSPHLVRLPCSVKYHYMFSTSTAGYVEWMIFVGNEVHTHFRPVGKAYLKLVRDHVRHFESKNATATPAQYAQ